MRRTQSSALSAALMLGLGLAASATPTQAAGIDNTFGFGGKAFTPLSQPLGDRFLNVVRGPAGGAYAVGYAVLSGTDRAMAVARVDRNGDLVGSFGNNGVASVNMAAPPFLAPPAGTAPTGAAEVARGIVVQSDGRIVISGFAETPSMPLPADSRDTDVYAARFYPDGTLDASFGVNGATRIDLAPSSSATATAPTGDQAYGLAIQPDDKLVIDAGSGTDDVARPGRTDRDLTAIRLTKDGVPDPTFKGVGQPDGISSIHATATNSSSTSVEVSENARQPIVQHDGRIVLGSYSSIPATPNAGNEGSRPFIARFNGDGTPDATFGTGGYASGQPLGATPSFSEAYDVALQSTESYVVVGYGSNAATVAATGTDAVAYRFTSAGALDPTFGTGGVTAYNQSGGTDQARDISVLPDGRLAIVGNTVPGGAGNGANGFVMVLSADGAPDTSVTPGGVFQFELGGPSDSFMRSTLVASGTKVVAAGYCGAAAVAGTTNGDNAVTARVELTAGGGGAQPVITPVPSGSASATCPAGPGAGDFTGEAGPAGPPGTDGVKGDKGDKGDAGAPGGTGATGPVGAGGPTGAAGPRGATGPRGPSANIRVTCRLTGVRKNKIACTVRRVSTARGLVRLRLSRAGRVVANGERMGRGSSTVVGLRGKVHAGLRYTLNRDDCGREAHAGEDHESDRRALMRKMGRPPVSEAI